MWAPEIGAKRSRATAAPADSPHTATSSSTSARTLPNPEVGATSLDSSGTSGAPWARPYTSMPERSTTCSTVPVWSSASSSAEVPPIVRSRACSGVLRLCGS